MTVSNNRLPIIVLFAANAISLTGNILTTVAIPWFVLQTTGSPAKTGVTGFFSILPVVLAGFLGGALVDRLGYKRTSILADLASGITVALVPLLHLAVGLQFWQLIVLVFLGAFLDAPGSTARYALVPELAELAGMPIERATSLTQIIERKFPPDWCAIGWRSDCRHWNGERAVVGCNLVFCIRGNDLSTHYDPE